MVNMEDKVREKLVEEAAQWVEEELGKRMIYAREAIEEQVNISEDMCGPQKAEEHVKEATALAQENIRLELEFEAEEWVEGKLKERGNPLLEDHDLEGNLC